MKTHSRNNKKNTSNSHNKSKTRATDKQLSKSCLVCHRKFKKENQQSFRIIICSKCQKWAHQYCYIPLKLQKNQKFQCDVCKYNQNFGEVKCFFCQSKSGIFKKIGNNSQFSHVLCALTSNKILINSYSPLQLKLQEPKQKNNKKHPCFLCQKQSDTTLKCSQCEKYAHINCVLMNQEENDSWSTVFELLDKTQSSLLNNKLKNFKNYYPTLQFLNKINSHQRKNIHIICPQHQEYWCTCGKSLNDQLIQCDKCLRWMHIKCSGVKDVEQDYTCRSCKQKDMFHKKLAIPELLKEIKKIEEKDIQIQSQKNVIRFLDAFPFKFSKKINKKLVQQNWVKCIENYYIKKHFSSFHQIIKTNKQQKQQKFIQRFKNYKIPELIYYLDKRKIITPKDYNLVSAAWQNIKNQSIISQISKYIKKYIKILTFKKQHQEIKECLDRIISHPDSYSNVKALAFQLKNIVYLVKKKDITSSFVNKINNNCSILKLLFQNNLNEKQIQNILDNWVYIVNCKKQNNSIPQKNYYRIISECKKNQKDKKKQMQQFYENLLRNINIKRDYEEKQKLEQIYESKLANNNFNYKELIEIRRVFAQSGFMSRKDSAFLQVENRLFNIQVLKNKCLKEIEKTKDLNCLKLRNNIDNILKQDGKLIQLSNQQKDILINYRFKNQFYVKFIDSFKTMNQNLMEIQDINDNKINKMEQENIEDDNQTINLEKQSLNLMKKFKEREIQCIKNPFELLKDLNFFATNRVKFTGEKWSAIQQFTQCLLDCVNQQYQKCSDSLYSQKLIIIKQIIDWTGQTAEYLTLCQCYEKYKQWYSEISQRCNNFQNVLEKEQQIQEIIEIIQKTIHSSNQTKIDVSLQIHKLKVLRLWCEISLKFFVCTHKKPTINAIQTLRLSIDRLKYPHNKIYDKIIKMDRQSRDINKIITRFLERLKNQDNEIHEELMYIQSKMTIQEGNNLLMQLQRCSLDVNIEIQEVKQEIKQFQSIPQNLEMIIKHGQLMEITALRKKIHQNAFKFEKLDSYDRLIRRMYELRCYQWDQQSTSITKKQYMRQITLGGCGAIQLINRSKNLKKNYHDIQKAEKQINCLKKRPQNLLQINEKKDRLLQLQNDSCERLKVQKWYQQAENIQKRFIQLRYTLVPEEKYRNLQNQISKCPINLKQITNEIFKMMKIHQDLICKTKKYSQNLNFSSQYSRNIIETYKKNGISCQQLDHYKKLYESYWKILEIFQEQQIDSYYRFSVQCQKFKQFENNDEIKRMRYQFLNEVYKDLSKQNQKKEIKIENSNSEEQVNKYQQQLQEQSQNQSINYRPELYNAFLIQGGYLLQFEKDRKYLLQKMLLINKKLQQLNVNNIGQSEQNCSEQSNNLTSNENQQLDDDSNNELSKLSINSNSSNQSKPHKKNKKNDTYYIS